MRRIKFVLGLGLVFVATLVCVVQIWHSAGLPRSQTLADRSVLTVESISVGNSISYHETYPKPWQLAVGKCLPYAVAAGLGWRFDTRGMAISISLPTAMTGLFIIAKLEGAASTLPENIQPIVLDDEGNSLDWNEGGPRPLSEDAKGVHVHRLRCWVVPAFPRRGNTLLIRFLQMGGTNKAGRTIMQFHVNNPQPAHDAIWTPEPWPATKHAGDLNVTLTDFTTGLSGSEPARAAVENEGVVTRLAFDLEEKGRRDCPWQVKNVEISDATGNRWNATLSRFANIARQRGATETLNLGGNLWPGESAWKLRVEFVPTSGADSDNKSRFVEFLAKPRTLSNKRAK